MDEIQDMFNGLIKRIFPAWYIVCVCDSCISTTRFRRKRRALKHMAHVRQYGMKPTIYFGWHGNSMFGRVSKIREARLSRMKHEYATKTGWYLRHQEKCAAERDRLKLGRPD